ncbi:MAG: CFI-box-CTERM domain-containing protein [Pseudomonadota bacterium]
MKINIITLYNKNHKISFIITAFTLLTLMFCGNAICEAAGTQLAWDESPESTVAGYYIYYGTESGNYDTDARIQVTGKSTTNYLIADLNLTSGQTYYIATTAYTDTGEESSYSNEVIYEEQNPEASATISDNNIEITYSESVENATVESHYTFSPSLNFATAGDDITDLGDNAYRLTMASIAAHTIYTLTIGAGITDAAGNNVSPNQITINDCDDDDMADDWEIANSVTDPNADPDNDGLTNVQEYENDTEPEISDTDNDGLSDGYEVTYGLDPAGNDDANDDPDSDGYTNYQECVADSSPLDANSMPAPPCIASPHPHHQAGIKDDTLIPTNTSFSVVLSDPCGFDMTAGGCVLLTITTEGYASYDRTLSNSSLRWVKKIDQNEPDTMVTKMWVVYDISTDSVPEIDGIDQTYPFGKTVAFEVFAQNRMGISATETYTIKIETMEQHDEALACQPTVVIAADSVTISGGTARDAKIIFNPEEPVTPSFGSSDGLPALDSVVSDVAPVGGALNLLPPTVFNQPVTISLPCPGVVDTSTLNIYYYTGETWILACDSAGNIKPDADDWMVAGSRQNFNEEIKIQVYHFSGVQAAITLPSGASGDSVVKVSDSGGSSGGGCFIATAAFGSYMEPHVQLLRDFRDLHLLSNTPGRWFVRTYYRYGPIAAHYINNNPYWKPVVRVALMPLVGFSYILVKTSGETKMLITILMVCCVLSLIVRNKLITENQMVRNCGVNK